MDEGAGDRFYRLVVCLTNPPGLLSAAECTVELMYFTSVAILLCFVRIASALILMLFSIDECLVQYPAFSVLHWIPCCPYRAVLSLVFMLAVCTML